MSQTFSEIFLPRKICVLSCSFWFNWAFHTFSTSKWPSALKFCERCTCSWQKKWPEMVIKWPNSEVVFFEQIQTTLKHMKWYVIWLFCYHFNLIPSAEMGSVCLHCATWNLTTECMLVMAWARDHAAVLYLYMGSTNNMKTTRGGKEQERS